MSDPNHAHEFSPNRKGLCKMIVSGAICHLPEEAPVHANWSAQYREFSWEAIQEEFTKMLDDVKSQTGATDEEIARALVEPVRRFMETNFMKEENRV